MEIKNNQELHLGLGTAVVGGAVGAVADAVKQHNYLKDIDGCLAKAQKTFDKYERNIVTLTGEKSTFFGSIKKKGYEFMQGFSKKAVEELNALKTSGNAKFNYGELAKKGGKFSAAAAGVYVAYKGIQSIFNGQ